VSFFSRRFNINAAHVYLFYVAAGALIRGVMFTLLAVYYVKVVGMDPLQLVLVGTAVEGTIVLLEIPTGVLADLYGRRRSIVLGQTLFGLAYVVQGTVPVFVPIIFAEVVRGIGETFLSGATQAWLTDEVGADRVAGLFLRAVQLRRAAALVGIVASVGLGSVDIALPIKVGAILSLLLAGGLVLLMPEHGFSRAPSDERPGFLATAKAGIAAVHQHAVLLPLLGLALVMGAASEGLDRLWEAHLLTNFTLPAIGSLAPVTWFGLISAAGLVLGIIATGLVQRLDTLDDRRIGRILIAAQGSRVAAIALFALTGSVGVAILARCATLGLGSVSGPLLDTWIARSTPAHVRATAFSVMSQGDAIGQVLGGPGIGAIGSLWSLRAALVGSAALVTPGLWLLHTAAKSAASQTSKPLEVAA
jgi:MFS transporter, DHA3 family, tetracycline resistance protein